MYVKIKLINKISKVFSYIIRYIQIYILHLKYEDEDITVTLYTWTAKSDSIFTWLLRVNHWAASSRPLFGVTISAFAVLRVELHLSINNVLLASLSNKICQIATAVERRQLPAI